MNNSDWDNYYEGQTRGSTVLPFSNRGWSATEHRNDHFGIQTKGMNELYPFRSIAKTSLQVSTKKYPANLDEYNEVRKKIKADIEREFKLSYNLRSYIILKKNKDRTIEEYETLEKLIDKTRLEYDSSYEYYRAKYFYKGNEINDTGKEKAKTDLSNMLIKIKQMGIELIIKKTEQDKAYSEYKKANNKLIKVIKLAKEREAVLNKTDIKDNDYLEKANNNLLVDEIRTEIIHSYSSGGYKSVKRVAKRPVNKVAKRPTKKPAKKPTTIPTKRPSKPSAKPTKRPVRK